MNTKRGIVVITILILVLQGHPAQSQTLPPTVLEIDTENSVRYLEDISEVSRFATDPGATTGMTQRNFGKFLVLGDIVAVNGQPARGTLVFNVRGLTLRTAPNPGEGIADVARGAVIEQMFEILSSDGKPIGTIVAIGLGGGTAPPGAPATATQGNNAIAGGTGAFLGARGQAGQTVTSRTVPDRVASMSEDPANRRRHGGGTARFVVHVIPETRPEIVSTSGSPAVIHTSDFSLVTASRPAAPGELLSLFATGLGPTTPAIAAAALFPSSPLAVVNAPVQVTVNGRPAQVVDAIGFPGSNGYQVNFRVPSDTPRGVATLQVTAAWVVGSEARINIQ